MTVSKRVQNNLALLKKLRATKNIRERRRILKSGDKDLIAALLEITANVLNRKVILRPDQVRKLSAYKRDFTKFGNTRSYKKGKELIVQNGGSFLPLLLGAVIPLITSLIKR